jgi:hypothetical protein
VEALEQVMRPDVLEPLLLEHPERDVYLAVSDVSPLPLT